jgi:biopolymer transport protein ExbD
MKFPRNARIFRGQLDAAPFASVFFLLIIFVFLSGLLYSPGIRVQLPSAGDLILPGSDRPTLSVALTTSNSYYFDDQLYTSENEFSNRLSAAAQNIARPVTLVVQADKDVSEEKLIHLTVLAHGASTNIQDLLVATLPRVFDSANGSSRP